jgi:hypothetical protein
MHRPNTGWPGIYFNMAVHLNPTFALAHAGLSFTSFQNAFQGWAERGPKIFRGQASRIAAR